MAPEPPVAHVVHRLPGRLRLRVAAKRGDAAWFDDAATTLAMMAGVEHVSTSPGRGSLLLRHARPAEDLLKSAAERGLFAVPAAEAAGEGAGTTTERLRAAASGMSGRGGLAVVLALAALREVLRGNIMPPAITLLAYAATVLAPWDRHPESTEAETADSQGGTGEPPPT
jgi:hypothetical protein